MAKCDKRQPKCLRCEKLGKPCPGYDKKRKFVDEGVSLRKKYQTSPLGGPSGDQDAQHARVAGTAASAPAGSLSMSPGSVPRHSFTSDNPLSGNGIDPAAGMASVDGRVVTTDPLLPAARAEPASGINPTLFPEANHALQGIQDDYEFENLFNDGVLNPEWFDLKPDTYYATGTNSRGFIPNAPIIDEVDRSDFRHTTETNSGTPVSGVNSFTGVTTNIWPPEGQAKISAIINDERQHEMAYLIRHFTESLGPWMDLFDKDKYFGHLVPLKALRDALLRNAIAAVAAKQLGRVKGNKPFLGNQFQKPAAMEVIEDVMETDWFYKAANYYDKAIAFSRTYLQELSGTLTYSPRAHARASSSVANSDDLLVAVSIFSLYESLDNRETGWLQHLAGLKSLLTAITPNQQDQLQLVPSITVGRKASFWNFVRADYQAAYINHQHTYLDTEDLPLWRSCGLQVQDDGSLYAHPNGIKNELTPCRQIAQPVSQTLLWLVLRVTNYLAQGQNRSREEEQVMWDTLTVQLDAWYDDLPETFQPCAQIRYPLQMRNHRGGTNGSQLTEVFFSINQCAAAIQLYHFARILLLLNKPDARSGVNGLNGYREVPGEAIEHAREIVGIALGRPHPAVRVEMLLPLYMAGMCLEADDERMVVVEVMRAIEKDTGCPTEVMVRSLIDEWGWNEESKGVA